MAFTLPQELRDVGWKAGDEIDVVLLSGGTRFVVQKANGVHVDDDPRPNGSNGVTKQKRVVASAPAGLLDAHEAAAYLQMTEAGLRTMTKHRDGRKRRHLIPVIHKRLPGQKRKRMFFEKAALDNYLAKQNRTADFDAANYFDFKTAAKMLSITDVTLREWIKLGDIEIAARGPGNRIYFDKSVVSGLVETILE